MVVAYTFVSCRRYHRSNSEAGNAQAELSSARLVFQACKVHTDERSFVFLTGYASLFIWSGLAWGKSTVEGNAHLRLKILDMIILDGSL